MRIGDCGDERARQKWTDAWDLHQPTTKLGLSRTRPDPAIVLKNLFLHDLELRLQHAQAEPRVSRYSGIVFVVDDHEQLLNSITTDRRHDPKLRQM